MWIDSCPPKIKFNLKKTFNARLLNIQQKLSENGNICKKKKDDTQALLYHIKIVVLFSFFTFSRILQMCITRKLYLFFYKLKAKQSSNCCSVLENIWLRNLVSTASGCLFSCPCSIIFEESSLYPIKKWGNFFSFIKPVCKCPLSVHVYLLRSMPTFMEMWLYLSLFQSWNLLPVLLLDCIQSQPGHTVFIIHRGLGSAMNTEHNLFQSLLHDKFAWHKLLFFFSSGTSMTQKHNLTTFPREK